MAQRADVAVEIERKFEMAASAAVDSLDPGAVLGVVPAEPQERLLEAVYYDTPDLRLLAERGSDVAATHGR
jgi:inorganic triphosphatase YgiF